jgi:hypothetical protein
LLLSAEIEQEKELGQISAAARCEELIGKHRGMFVDCAALLSDLDADKLSPEIFEKLAEHVIQKALAGRPPDMIEEARQRIEAGEEVTIEEPATGVLP